MAGIVLRREIECASAPRALFGKLGDTARLYRALGQPAMQRVPAATDDGARFELHPLVRRLRRGRAFTELPPEWTAPTQLCLRRAMKDGPLALTQMRFSLTPLLQGTKLAIELSLLPRIPALEPIFMAYGEVVLWLLSRTIRQLDAALLRGENLLLKPAVFDEAALVRAQARVAGQLEEPQRELLGRLITHLRGLDEIEVDALAPAALATALEVPIEALLPTLLIAAGHGLLALSWDVICPSCRLPAGRFSQLAGLPQQVHCDLCDLDVETDLAGNVEVSLRPAPALRKKTEVVYSGPGPAQQPHIVMQLLAERAGRVSVPAPTEPGDYELRVRGGVVGRLRVSPLGPPQARISIAHIIEPASSEVVVGGTLEIAHLHTQARHISIEHPERERRGVSGHEVTVHPVFRQHFPDEVLAPQVALVVPPVALWLSELTGTTEICAQLGDGAAYGVVEAHRQRLRECIAEEGGALLKCDRDSVGAVFREPEAAARAGAAAQRALAELRSERPELAPLALRIGVFAGPCSLLTQNGRLDYYGLTVLVAGRLLREAHAGDIVVPGDLGERMAAELGESVRLGPRFSIAVKGVPQPVSIARLTLVEPTAASAGAAAAGSTDNAPTLKP